MPRLVNLPSIDRALRFVRTPPEPVLAPYHYQRSPLEAATKKIILLSVTVLISAIYGFLATLLPLYFMRFLVIPIAVLAALVIWALPDRDSAPTVMLTRLYWAFWIGMTMWPAFLAIAIPGLPWISMERLIGFPMVVVFLAAISISAKFRAEMVEVLGSIPILWKMMVGFVLVQAISIGFSSAVGASLTAFFNHQLIWTSLFFLSVWIFREPERVRFWISLTLGMAIVICIIGVLEARNQRVLWAGHIPSFLRIDAEMLQAILQGTFRNGKYRVTTVFTVSLSLAEFLALICPFLLHAMFVARSAVQRALCVAADLLILTVIVNTQARLGSVGFLISHLMYGLFWAARRWRDEKSSILWPALTLSYPLFLGFVMTAVMSIHALSSRVFGDGYQVASNDARETQFNSAIPLLLQRPLFGYGPNQGPGVLNYRMPDGSLTVDSFLISIGLDYGMLGFILFYGMILVALFHALKLAMRPATEAIAYALPLAIALVVYLSIKTVLSQGDNNPQGFIMLAMVVGLKFQQMRMDAKDAKSAAEGRMPNDAGRLSPAPSFGR